MVKQITLTLVLSTLFLNSCDKVINSVIDCTAQSMYMKVNSITDANDSKKISFTATYSGDEYTINNVSWDFGDGSNESGNEHLITHTYEKIGSYKIKAVISIVKKNDKHQNCNSTINKTVVIK